MDTEKKKRGRPRKQKFFENSGMSYEGAINYALDKEVQSELDDTLAHKDEDELTDDERKYLKRKKEVVERKAPCPYCRGHALQP